MERPDLKALTPDDLAALANRGLVKRAQREAEAGDLTAQWQESDDGTVRAEWSDGVAATLPGGKTVKEAQCTCGALELCRHVLRTVLAWQRRQSSAASGEEAAPSAAWDPGSISDALLESQVAKAVRDRAAVLWSQGVLGEGLRSAKPSMRFHSPGHTVRFPVPNDLRYAQCSCADPAPCVHAVLAVRAFRLLAPDLASGIVSEGPLDVEVPAAPMTAATECLSGLLENGFASLDTAWRDQARRTATDCMAASLLWPAQILEELAAAYDHYASRDAAFHPGHAAGIAGELLLRLDAIRSGCAPIPQAFIRGMKTDRDSDLGAARFIGLGGSVVEERRSSSVTVFLQDCDNGHVVTLIREIAEDPESASARKAFHELARATAVKDASLGLLAAGQLVTQGGRRKASGQLVMGRARAVVNPQNYAWEQLKAPVLVEDFGELSARLRLLPPASFRPRRAAADFHVCPISSAESAVFQASTNSVTALLTDCAGHQAILAHPWTERGQAGAEALLAALRSGARPLFVAGLVRAAGGSLVIRPTAVVFADESGARRGILPWLQAPGQAATAIPAHPAYSASAHSAGSRYRAAAELATELVLSGLRRVSGRQWPGWSRSIRETEECGYHRMAAMMRKVQSSGAAADALQMLKLLTLAQDAAGRPGSG